MTKLMDLRQERFCQEMLKGSNQSDAYRVANPLSKRWKPETIHKKASEMIKLEEVQSRIEALKQASSKVLIKTFTKTKSDVLNKLESLIEKADKYFEDAKREGSNFKFPLKDYIKEVRGSLKEQAKILGYYEEVHRHKGDPDHPIEHKLNVNFIGVKK